MESKHCVQSSRYTDCVGPGGRSSRRCEYHAGASWDGDGDGALTRRVDVRAGHADLAAPCVASLKKSEGRGEGNKQSWAAARRMFVCKAAAALVGLHFDMQG